MNQSLKCIDAFCGAGGLSLGLQRSGFNVVYGFDNDQACIETLRQNPHHIRHVVALQDIRTLSVPDLLDLLNLDPGELDLLAGGPPCQGFSHQRTSGDDHDERNLLVHDYGDLILKVLPRYFLLENVVGIGGRRGRHILTLFCQRMSNHGYIIHERILDAQNFGVPQRRRRLFVVGERNTAPFPQFDWPRRTVREPVTVRSVIGHLPPPPEDGTEHCDYLGHRADRISELNRRRLQALLPGQSRVDLPIHLLSECHKASADEIGHRNVYGRMAWDDVAPTITARFDSFTRGKFGHPEQLRTVSLYEGALLQTFPKDYRFFGNKVEVARQIGNAVPPKLAEVLGRAIVQSISNETGIQKRG